MLNINIFNLYALFIDSEINQLLGVFFDKLISQSNRDILLSCLVGAVNSIFTAPYDSLLHDIQPESIARFIIDATCNDLKSHIKLAKLFLEEMLNTAAHKDVCIFLSKKLMSLDLFRIQNAELKSDLYTLVDKVIQVNLKHKVREMREMFTIN